MEDRYLFKAKRIDNGEWVQGYYVKGLDLFKDFEEAHLIFEPNTVFYSSGETDGWHKIDPNTICQCTGLKDKNGKLIWENDIASYSDLITGDKKIICIEWNKMQASFVRKYRSPMGLQYIYIDEYIASRMEIIGNIFDNPELLESEG